MTTQTFTFDVTQMSQLTNGTFISVTAEIDTEDLPLIADDISSADICNSDKNKDRLIEEIGIKYIVDNVNSPDILDCLIDLIGVDEIMTMLKERE